MTATPIASAAPRYAHDCAKCVYLGRHEVADLYFCPAATNPTVIGRFSDEGPDYASGMSFAYGANAVLTEARQRAAALGLVAYDVKDAVHTMREDAPVSCKAELKEQLLASPVGKALLLLSEDTAEGMSTMRQLIDEHTAAYQTRFPDKPYADLKSWSSSFVANAHSWFGRLGLPITPHRTFLLAVYGY